MPRVEDGATEAKRNSIKRALDVLKGAKRPLIILGKGAAYAQADAARPPGTDTVLLWNERGDITEAPSFNVVAEIDGRRVTPPVECGLLPGTLRQSLLDDGAIAEAPISREALLGAQRIWLINSVRGWVDATLVRPVIS